MPAQPRGGFHRFTHAPWWVHVLATLGALAVLAAIGATVATALFVDFVREHGPASQEIPPQSELPAEEALDAW